MLATIREVLGACTVAERHPRPEPAKTLTLKEDDIAHLVLETGGTGDEVDKFMMACRAMDREHALQDDKPF